MHFFKVVWWRKIQRKKCTCWHMLACFNMTLACFSMTRFQRRCAEKLFKLYIINFGQSSKGASFPEKKWNENAHLHSISITTTKFHKDLFSSFRGVALTKKSKTDGRTDGLTDGQVKYNISSAIRCVGYN